ncbi:TetR/AcrR family transcriptional regulator [Gordonia hongkongensis]|uniref:TetR/AcrR family transcriptional regulator n=1 Tax=Gordonia hongkongensis TaxID=1701090 RepID=UPI001FF72463|nr:TetR/AcrR family transcriptional regulator [Gordonia hongkongensis]UPG66406.1 TetR/AcrR family transcriptional regulator [Gordonia hongkongensis]
MRSKSGTGARTFADEARRKQIVACAMDLIADVGYPRASLAKIAERADIAKSVVLYHFRDKDELVSAVVETVFATSANIMVPRILSASGARDRLRAYIESNGEFLDAHRRPAIALYEISTSYRDRKGRRFDEAIQAAVDDIGVPEQFAPLDPLSILRSGIQDGDFVTDVDPIVLKNLIRSALDGAVAELARDDTYDVTAHTSALSKLVLSAIGAPP